MARALLVLILVLVGCRKQRPVVATPTPPAVAPPAVATPPTPARRTDPSRTTRPRAAPPAATPTPPVLQEMLSEPQRQALRAEYEAYLQQAEAALAGTSNRSLSVAQQNLVSQIRSLLAQARQLQATDLSAAHNLAERADVLARELR